MSTSPKIISIIKALETIDSTSFEQLCSELVYAGALIPDLKHKPISLTGTNIAENHTVRSPQDAVIRLEEGKCVFEFSRAKRWKDKLKSEVEKWAEREESQELARFIFVTTRNIASETINCGRKQNLTPEDFIRKRFSQPDIQVNVFGQNDLLLALENEEHAHIRRKWLKIPEDYFQSLESFESIHIKQAQVRHIHLENFVETSSRHQSINALGAFVVQTDVRVLLIHSQGGIGKTRFVLEVLKRGTEHTKDIDILFNQTKKNVNVDEVLPEISKARNSLIVLDDAHQIDNLRDFEKILIKRHYAKLILITRSTARESVKHQIVLPTEELQLTPLNTESSIELLKNNLEYPRLDQRLRQLAHICEGSPLLIGFATHLINAGKVQSFGGLKTDDLVRKYLDNILADLNQYSQINRNHYEPYLALLFLFKPFSIDDAETRLLIESLANIDELTQGFLRRDLEQYAILERHGNTLWLYPDLLGEYLVKTTFFEDTRIQNFDEVFSKIPSSHIEGVFRTLRELDNARANQFLKVWARHLSRNVESQDNDELSESLQLLEIIASIGPDETLEIIDYLLNPDSDKPTAKADDDWWSPKPRTYYNVLSQCLNILKNPSLRHLNFDDALEQLLKMYFYKPEKQEYSGLREQARNAITNMAAYDLNLWYQDSGYSIQTRMFEKVQKWNQEDLEKYLPLILGVCGKLLETEMRSEYSDSEVFSWSRRPVMITDDLVSLRESIISLLQLVFNRVQGAQRIKVIRVLNCATEFPDLGQYGEEMRTMIQDNAEALINFYLWLVTANKSREDEIFQEIETQIHHLKTWHLDDIKNVNRLSSMLQSHESYQLYRTLVGDESLFWGEEGKSYDEIQTEAADKITKIADAITHENLIEWFEKLKRIAENFTNRSDQDISRFYQLLFEIGESKPHIAQALIDKSLTENNSLKKCASEFIRGIRKSTSPAIAGNYVHEWLSGGDQKLLLQIPNTYWRVDEKSLAAGDVLVFETLLNCKMENENQRQKLDKKIMSNIGWIYKTNPDKTIEIICKLFERADQNSILHHMNQLWWSRERIDLSQWDLSVFENLLKTFVDIPILNDNAVYILAQYGRKAPLELVQFFECRVEKQKRTSGRISRYNPIPHFLKEIADIYQNHPQYVDILNQILGWFQKHDYHYDTAAAELISGISPRLDEPLKQTLTEFIKSGDKEKILAVMKVLEKFPEDSVSDELCKQAVKHSERQKELRDEIGSFIVNRVRVYLGLDGAVTTFQNLKERIIPWLEDENHYVRAFAQRIIPKIESRIEYERERAAEDEIKRKKGLL